MGNLFKVLSALVVACASFYFAIGIRESLLCIPGGSGQAILSSAYQVLIVTGVAGIGIAIWELK